MRAWCCTCDAVGCRGHSAMNVSHHVRIKCAFNVWGPSTCIQYADEHLYTETDTFSTYWTYVLIKKKTCVFLYVKFFISPFFSIPVLFQYPNMEPSSCFGLFIHKPSHLCISSLSFTKPTIRDTHTHTHTTNTLPTLLLLTAVCSETVESQRCHLSGEPLMERFYVVELMQLFFSGQ